MDKYSLLHFATGIVAHFWALDRIEFFIYHLLFEIIENSPIGIALINRLPFWPGGKSVPDAWINILGDNLFALFGHWLMSSGIPSFAGSLRPDACTVESRLFLSTDLGAIADPSSQIVISLKLSFDCLPWK